MSIPSPNTAIRTKKSFTSPISAAVINADPDIAPLLKEQRELENLLKEVKEKLDTAEQAKKIERGSKAKDENGSGEIDGELVDLCEKWRSASRLAAEELFGQVRDRVNRYVTPCSGHKSCADIVGCAGWVDQELGRKCKRNNMNTKTIGIKMKPIIMVTITLMMRKRRVRTKKNETSMQNIALTPKRRMRKHRERQVSETLERIPERKM